MMMMRKKRKKRMMNIERSYQQDSQEFQIARIGDPRRDFFSTKHGKNWPIP
jgi:hypothetical protein